MQRPLTRCTAVASTSGSVVAASARAPPPRRSSHPPASSRRRRRPCLRQITLRQALPSGGFSFFLGGSDGEDEGDDERGGAAGDDEEIRRRRALAAASGWEDEDAAAAAPTTTTTTSSYPPPPFPPPPPPPPPTGWEPSAESLRRAAAAASSSSKRNRRRDTPRGPRDEFVRPIIDPFGVGLRLGPDPTGAEEDLDEELEANRSESAAAGAFLATALGCCAAAGFAAGHVVAQPLVLRLAASPITTTAQPGDRAFAELERERTTLATALKQVDSLDEETHALAKDPTGVLAYWRKLAEIGLTSRLTPNQISLFRMLEPQVVQRVEQELRQNLANHQHQCLRMGVRSTLGTPPNASQPNAPLLPRGGNSPATQPEQQPPAVEQHEAPGQPAVQTAPS